ncbi:hypothetical protein Tco_0808831 [Tanacetum coccineum]
MSNTSAHQQVLADAGSKTRSPMLERGPYQMKMLQPNLDEPPRLQNKDDLMGNDLKQYEADNEVMNLILISIPNDIYNSVDACQNASDIWDRVRRLMQGIELSDIDRESRFSNKFDQFTAEAEESLTSVYNRFLQLINDLQRNNVKLPNVTINTKFLNCLKPEWYKYVTNVRLAKNLKDDSYDMLFDHLQQYEKLVIAFRAKRTAKIYDPLTLIMIYDYQGDTFSDDQDDNLTSIMMPLTRAITQRYSTLTNNRLRTSSNTRNQAVVKGNATNVLCYNYNAKCHYARDCLKPRVRDSKYFMEQMLLAKKDEVRVILSNE